LEGLDSRIVDTEASEGWRFWLIFEEIFELHFEGSFSFLALWPALALEALLSKFID
jgi:hypothetical protein